MTDPIPESIGGHTLDDLARIAREEIPGGATPGFAAVSGSHSYGWADESSDVDLRGFHVADGHRYALLDPPDEQVAATVASRGGSGSDVDAADLDFVSRELRTFGVLVAARNFNALETLLGGIVIVDEHPDELEALRDLVEDSLPMDVPARYAGMARSNRDAAVAGGSSKRCLYAVRGLLAAHHVFERQAVEADIRTLSEAVLGDTALVDDLVAAKRADPDGGLDEPLADRASALLDDLAGGEWPAHVDAGGFRRGVDGWMRGVRGWDA